MEDEREPPEERPPLLGSWRALYTVVLGAFALLVVLFTILTWSYR